MSWTYGWLVKGRMEVSVLDGLICLAEVGVLFWFLLQFEKAYLWWKRR